ncbi:hypothetical protein H4219_003199 [Mycoemilia scoparia]|uniref:Uncharacterized protein n=1 Tax=Mycoemilia scoparia TaxID=417184 RepID=A0A9W8DPL1_9FUNG|nr:hypothetical protein H4219_003199 [Mycoemilia scoparia]
MVLDAAIAPQLFVKYHMKSDQRGLGETGDVKANLRQAVMPSGRIDIQDLVLVATRMAKTCWADPRPSQQPPHRPDRKTTAAGGPAQDTIDCGREQQGRDTPAAA